MNRALDAESPSSRGYVGPVVGTRSAGILSYSAAARGAQRRSESFTSLASHLRPGAVLAVSVVAVVGCVGIFQWNQALIITGLVAGVVILMLNIVLAAISHWHRENTQIASSYSAAEDMVRMRRAMSADRTRRQGESA